MSERVEKSWATRTVSAHLGNDWYGVAEEIVEDLAEEMHERPYTALARRLKEFAEEQLLYLHVPKHPFQHTIIVNFLQDVHWDAIAREYEEDLVAKGGIKLSDYEWEWVEYD